MIRCLPRKATRMAEQVLDCDHIGVINPVHNKSISKQIRNWRLSTQSTKLWMIIYQDTHCDPSQGLGT
jgi:hypothetical protein